MSFVNGVLDSSPVALPKINPHKRTIPSLDDVASRVASGKKRKADHDHASSTLLERGAKRTGGKRFKTTTRGGRENDGNEHPSQIPITNVMKREEASNAEEICDEATVERFLRLGPDPSRCTEQIQAPLTPPASYRTVQPRASAPRAVSEPASPSSTLNSSPKSICSTAADVQSHLDLDNPFLETPFGMTRPALLRRTVPDSPDEVDAEKHRRDVLNQLRGVEHCRLSPLPGATGEGGRKEYPPVEVDSQGEKSHVAWLYRGRRVMFPNEFFNKPHDPRESLPVSHGDYEPPLTVQPKNLFPKAKYGREARLNSQSSSSTHVLGVVAEDPFIDRPMRKRT